MPIVLLRLKNPQLLQDERPPQCPYCGSITFQRWGQAARDLQDTRPINTIVYRYYCNQCGRTFRHYPEGMDRSPLSIRIRRLAALIWVMDLSVRDVVDVFDELGVSMNRMTVWREGQKLIDELNNRKLITSRKRYTIDKSSDLYQRPEGSVVLAIGLEPGKIAVLGTLNTTNPSEVVSWLRPLMEEFEIDISSLATKEFTD